MWNKATNVSQGSLSNASCAQWSPACERTCHRTCTCAWAALNCHALLSGVVDQASLRLTSKHTSWLLTSQLSWCQLDTLFPSHIPLILPFFLWGFQLIIHFPVTIFTNHSKQLSPVPPLSNQLAWHTHTHTTWCTCMNINQDNFNWLKCKYIQCNFTSHEGTHVWCQYYYSINSITSGFFWYRNSLLDCMCHILLHPTH